MGIVNQSKIIQITCADTALLLNRISKTVILKDVRYLDEFTLQIQCESRQYPVLYSVVQKLGGSVTVVKANPLTNITRQFLRRPVLTLFVVLILLCSAYLPTRILFLQVEGNAQIPTGTILDSAEKCGVRFGAARSFIRSEQVKNNLLEQFPQLQWVGVNTTGCVATIQVLEKNKTEDIPAKEQSVSNIVAATDGIVLQYSATKGTALCKTGQAVKTGQVLISGYTDNGLTVTATQAAGEVQALTSRSLQLVTPMPTTVRGEIRTIKQYFSIRIGKNLINLQKDSGIYGGSCAKIYEEDYVCLPGGFQLPVSLSRTTEIWYETLELTQPEEEDAAWMSSFAKAYLQRQMIGGQILSAEDDFLAAQDCICLQSEYICREMIGRIKYEERMYQHGEND